MPTITVARALTAHVARRIIRLATIGVLIAFGVATVITAMLVYFFSPWWWLLLLPFGLLLGIFFLVRLFITFIIRRIHAERLSPQQDEALEAFTGKIQALLEARATPPPLIVLICIKDLLVHHDIVTIKKLIKDSAGLMAEYKQLEKLF